MEDYEFYNVDPYNPLDPDREIDTVREVLAMFSPAYQRAEAGLAQLFKPVAKVNYPGCMFPLNVAVIAGIPLLECQTVSDIEATLLRRHN